MNASLSNKDRKIVELHKEVNAVIDKASGLSSQLEEAKLIVMQSYRSSFNEAIRQGQHFFANNGLDFNLLNPSKFLEDILSDEIGVDLD